MIKRFYIPGGWPIFFIAPFSLFFLFSNANAIHLLSLPVTASPYTGQGELGSSSDCAVLPSTRYLLWPCWHRAAPALSSHRVSVPGTASVPLCAGLPGCLLGCRLCSVHIGLGFGLSVPCLTGRCLLPAPLVLCGQPSTKEEMEMVDSERPPAKKNWYERYVLPFFAELLGTAAFVFIGCMSVVEDSGNTGTMQPALVHGLSIVPIVVSLENIR